MLVQQPHLRISAIVIFQQSAIFQRTVALQVHISPFQSIAEVPKKLRKCDCKPLKLNFRPSATLDSEVLG